MPPPPGETLLASGFVIGIGERSVHFYVEARLGARLVASGTLAFAIVQRPLPRAAAEAPGPQAMARRHRLDPQPTAESCA